MTIDKNSSPFKLATAKSGAYTNLLFAVNCARRMLVLIEHISVDARGHLFPQGRGSALVVARARHGQSRGDSRSSENQGCGK